MSKQDGDFVAAAGRLCKRILDIDKRVRFAGVANYLGKIIVSEYRAGLKPLLTKEESEISVIQSAIRMGTRKALEEKLGMTIYAFAMYEKVKRVTIPLGRSILMVSFDIDCEQEAIILEKILPMVKETLGSTSRKK